MSDEARPVETISTKSPTIGAIAAALAKAQGQMRTAAKDSLNPHFKSRYADLASVWDACREPLSSNGIAVVQLVGTDPRGVALTTMLAHASGEWICDRCIFPVAQQTAQGHGSAITYARRYSLAAMVGVAPDEDDDGNAASQPRQSRPSPPAAGKPASDWTNGAPASAVAKLEVAIAEAQSRVDLDKLVPRIKQLMQAEQDAVRPLFTKAMERVSVPAQR